MPAQTSQNTLATIFSLSLLAVIWAAVIQNSFAVIRDSSAVVQNLEKGVTNQETHEGSMDAPTPPKFVNAPSELLKQNAEASPFFTRHFAQTAAPDPKPASPTRKVKIEFQGFYRPVSGKRIAFLQVDGAFKTVSVGEVVVANLRLLRMDSKEIAIGEGGGEPRRIGFSQSNTFQIPQ